MAIMTVKMLFHLYWQEQHGKATGKILIKLCYCKFGLYKASRIKPLLNRYMYILRLIKFCTLYCLENQTHTRRSLHSGDALRERYTTEQRACGGNQCPDIMPPAPRHVFPRRTTGIVRHTQRPYSSYDVSVSLIFKILTLDKVNIQPKWNDIRLKGIRFSLIKICLMHQNVSNISFPVSSNILYVSESM